MRPGQIGRWARRLFLSLALGFLPVDPTRAEEAPPAAEDDEDSASGGHKLVVLDPVDLAGGSSLPEWGLGLRGIFGTLPKWRVVDDDTLKAKQKEQGKPAAAACHAFQCAFDAGTLMLAEFTVFGTITRIDGWYAYTLDIVHVASAQPVWSRVGEVSVSQGPRPGADLARHLRLALSAIDPDTLKVPRRKRRGSVTILEAGPPSAVSRVVSERLATRLHGTRNFTVMTQAEQDELLDALEIEKEELVPSDTGIFGLAGRMGLTHLLYARLAGDKPPYTLSLAFYDLEDHRKVLDWPSRPARDFPRLVDAEGGFFTTLFTPLDAAPPADRGVIWMRAGAGAGLGLAMGAGVLALLADEGAGPWVFGGLTGAFLAAGGLFFYLSF